MDFVPSNPLGPSQQGNVQRAAPVDAVPPKAPISRSMPPPPPRFHETSSQEAPAPPVREFLNIQEGEFVDGGLMEFIEEAPAPPPATFFKSNAHATAPHPVPSAASGPSTAAAAPTATTTSIPVTLEELKNKVALLRRESIRPAAADTAATGIEGLRTRVAVLQRADHPLPPPPTAHTQPALPPPSLADPGSLRRLAEGLFKEGPEIKQVHQALTRVVTSSKDGATQASRIKELAEIVKECRGGIKFMLRAAGELSMAAAAFEEEAGRAVQARDSAAPPDPPPPVPLSQTSEAELRAQLAAAKAQALRAEASLKQLQARAAQDMGGVQGEVSTLQREIARLTEERDLAREQQRRADRARAEAEESVKASRREGKEAARAADVEKERLNRELAETRREAARLEEELRSAVAALERRLHESEDRAGGAEARVQELLQVRAQLETDVRSRDEEVSRLRRELEDARGLEGRIRRELSDASLALERVRAELEGAREGAERRGQDLSAREQECRQLSEDLAALRHKSSNDAAEWGQLRQNLLLQLGELKDRRLQLESEVGALGASRAHWQDAARELQGKWEALREEAAQLTRDLEESRTVRAEVEEELRARKEKAQALESDLVEVSDQLGAAQRELRDKSERLDLIESELEALKEFAGGDDRDALSRLVSRVALLEGAAAENEARRRKLQNALIELKGNIRVYCRVRPSTSAASAVQCLPDGAALRIGVQGKDHPFAFDKVFPPAASQEAIFNEVSELVQSALDGYKVCLFSYGQTGAGKTHTMQGTSAPSGRGIIPRAIDKLLESAHRMKAQGWEYKIEATFVEIYNESLRDLLGSGARLDEGIQHGALGGHTHVQGAARFPIASAEEAAALIRRANQARAVEATAMNAVSSRSHSVFMIYVTGAHEGTGTRLTGALNLVDLAGSERLDRSKAEGARQKEACAINKSLSALGDVFQALATKSGHVPYRNSKLTLLLQPCLGGDGKTLMFVNVNPDPESAGESLCSLRFAAKVNACETAARGGAKKNISFGPAGGSAEEGEGGAAAAAPPPPTAAAAAGSSGVGVKRKAAGGAPGPANGKVPRYGGGG